MKFIQILEQSSLVNHIGKVKVDKNPDTGMYPIPVRQYQIKEVPTLLVGMNKLEGKDAFIWLQTQIENSQDQVPQASTRHNKVNPKEINQQKAQPTAVQSYNFDSGIQSSFSDQCVSLNNTHGNTILTPSCDEDFQEARHNFTLPQDNMISTDWDQHPSQQKQKQSNFNMQSRTTSDSGQLPTLSVSKDALKKKQYENEYNKLIKQREQDIPDVKKQV